MRLPDLATLEPEKHQRLIDQYFPMGRHFSNALQYCGAPPKDFARDYYALDGNDIRHCGPDSRTLNDETETIPAPTETPTSEISYADGTKYRGPCIAGGVPHGSGAILVEINGTRYEGGFQNGVRDGIGRLTLSNGITYEGEFIYPGGNMHGHGTLLVPEELQAEIGIDMYAGHHAKGFRSGDGTLTYPDGATYEGHFSENMRHGQGTLKTEVSRYDGPWEGDRPGIGDADATYPSGFRYVGEMSGGLRNGEGHYFDPRGREVYAGFWKDDDVHGQGTFHYEDGDYSGAFVAGMREGTGRFTWTNGKKYNGLWRADQPDGLGSYTEADGFVHQDIQIINGEFASVRPLPPPKGLKERILKKKPQVPKVSAKAVATPRDWARSKSLFTPRVQFTAKLPKVMEALDIPSGVAHARVRAAHMGFEGVPGSRWL